MRTFEAAVQDMKVAVLALARDRNADSAVVIAALADVIGLTAASLDLHAQAMDLDTRLDSVLERVRQAHGRTLVGLARVGRAGSPG